MTTIQQSNLAFQKGCCDQVYPLSLEQVDGGHRARRHREKGASCDVGGQDVTFMLWNGRFD